MAPHDEADEHSNWYGSEAERRGRLRLIRSPVVGEKVLDSESSSLARHQTGEGGGNGVSNLGFRDLPGAISPEFQRHEEATNIELFFDLFFAANLTVFSQVHETSDASKLASYVGYFIMLWLTWALVGFFDVRFLTDSIFERIARCAHLGVMIGFAVVAPNFDPSNQQAQVFRSMSLILMVSRLTLALQYGTIIFHTRKYKASRLPLMLTVVLHFISAMIYLGIAFRFRDYNSQVYIAWYIIGIIELLLQSGMSLVWDVLTFRNTHLANRMSLLTLIIMGEGIIVIASNVTVVVKNPDAWTPPTIGVVVAAVGTIYCIYNLYFDLNRHTHMPRVRQLVWTFLHLPFHLALTLFVEGSSQFILWWKIVEVVQTFYDTVLNTWDAAATNSSLNVTTEWVVDAINATVENLFAQGYSPKYYNTIVDIDEALGKLRTLPDSFWLQATLGSDAQSATFNESFAELIDAVRNSLFASFGIDSIETAQGSSGADFEDEVNTENAGRAWLVFVYVFAVAGVLLILLNILYIVSRMNKGRWGFFNWLKVIVSFVLGIGLTLVLLLACLNADLASLYYHTPWILPTMLLTFFVVLVLSHVPHPPALLVGRNRMARAGSSDGGVVEGGHVTMVNDNGEHTQKEHTQGVHGQSGDQLKTPAWQQYESQQYTPAHPSGDETRA